ncbi:MAG: glycosyltransferase family 4 protein [Acidobacteria bacterium]|nr:glycosyltransferase family 4 protein [Acidobacteriota bacterium]
MDTKPRVAIVAASLDIVGGQGVQAQSLVGALRREGYRISFVSINPRFPPGLRWLRRIRYARTVANELLYVPSLAQLAAADIVHVFSASYWSFLLAPAPAILAGRLLNRRVVLHYHSGEAEDHLAHWRSRVHPWLRLADEIVVPSGYLAGIFARHGYDATVIENVIDVSRFGYRERRPLRPRLLSTRNLEPHYGLDIIIRAFAEIHRDRRDATLTIAGCGTEESRLRRLAASVAPASVRFAGKIPPDGMPNLYAESDLFLNASTIDNQPVSLLEAFASGLPVISTPTGDIRAMLENGQAGVLVPPNDPRAMAAAVMTVLNDPAPALAKARRARRTLDRHTWPAVRDEWSAVYARGQRHGASRVQLRTERL